MPQGSDIRGAKRGVEHPPTWELAARVDGRVAVLVAMATALTSGALFWTRFVPVQLWSTFAWVAPAVSVLFFVSLVAMFLERSRHGLVRGLLVTGAAILVAMGTVFLPHAGLAWTIVSYFAPGGIALVAALMLRRVQQSRTHRFQERAV